MFGKRRRDAAQQGAPAPAPSTGTTSSSDEHLTPLSRVPLFVDLSKRELQRLAGAAVVRVYDAGDVLVRQGQPGVGLFVILAGGTRVTQQSEGGDLRELGQLGAGEVFGEMSLLDDLPRSATVTATAPTQALLIPVYDFRAALHDEPDIAIRLLAVLSRRLRRSELHQV